MNIIEQFLFRSSDSSETALTLILTGAGSISIDAWVASALTGQ